MTEMTSGCGRMSGSGSQISGLYSHWADGQNGIVSETFLWRSFRVIVPRLAQRSTLPVPITNLGMAVRREDDVPLPSLNTIGILVITSELIKMCDSTTCAFAFFIRYFCIALSKLYQLSSPGNRQDGIMA